MFRVIVLPEYCRLLKSPDPRQGGKGLKCPDFTLLWAIGVSDDRKYRWFSFIQSNFILYHIFRRLCQTFFTIFEAQNRVLNIENAVFDKKWNIDG
jgi:hypothetical protein